MEKLLTKLPPQLQQELNRWYAISCGFIVIAFIGMAGIHSWTTMQLQQLPEVIEQPIPVLDAHTCELLQKHTTEIEALNKQQKNFLLTLAQFINTMPDVLHFTKLIVEPKHIECFGSAAQRSAIPEFMQTLKYEGFSCTLVDIKNEHGQQNAVSFHLQARMPK